MVFFFWKCVFGGGSLAFAALFLSEAYAASTRNMGALTLLYLLLSVLYVAISIRAIRLRF